MKTTSSSQIQRLARENVIKSESVFKHIAFIFKGICEFRYWQDYSHCVGGHFTVFLGLAFCNEVPNELLLLKVYCF